MSDEMDALGFGSPPPIPGKAFDPESAKEMPPLKTPPTPEHKNSRGRPKKSDRDKLVRVNTRLAPKDLERVRRLAEKTGHQESAIIRELILLGLSMKNAR